MIPVCEPTLSGNESKYVADCLKTNWISSSGGYIKKFEEKFSKYCGVKHGISTTSGTTALHLALETLGIRKGDEVIIPTFTMMATAYSVLYTGAKPVFVDADKTWNINVNQIEEKINEKTKAIIPVHIYGHPCDMNPILEIAVKNNLHIIEDAAEAHGAEYKGKKAGSLSDIACFSFYANKIITTGEGGMMITNNDQFEERARILKNHGFNPKPEDRFKHIEIGYNYRMTNIQAAIGLAQLEKIDELANKRIKNAELYNSLLKNIKEITLPPQELWAKNVYWMYGILIEDNFGLSRNEVMIKLREKGIETRPFFVPMHQQPVFKTKSHRYKNLPDTNGSYPIADEISRKGLYLPSSSSLTKDQIGYITETLRSLKP